MMLAAILAIVWLSGSEGPSAVVDAPNLTGRVVESRYDGTNDYLTIYLTHELDRAPSVAVDYLARSATNTVYGTWLGGWTNKVDVGSREYTPDDYVSEGLVAMWDGVWNVGRDRHSDDPSTWTDLIGSLNVALSGVTVGDDYIHFSKSLGRGTAKFSSLTPYGCMEVVIAKAQAGDHYNIISVGSQYSGWGICDSNGKITDTNDAKSSPYVTMCYGLNLPPTTITINYLNNTAQCGEIAKNGEIGSDGILPAGGRYNAGTDTINVGGGRSADKRIYSLRIYDRNLTAKEIANNYQVDHARFGGGSAAKYADCRILVVRRPIGLRSADARPALRVSYGSATVPFAARGVDITVNSNAVEIVDGVLKQKGN